MSSFHAFSWTQKSGMVDLGMLPGQDLSLATGVNNSRQIVGDSFTVDVSAGRAVLWQAR